MIFSGFVSAVNQGIKGQFSWSEWGKDVGLAAATSLIVFPLAIGGGNLAGNIAMNRLGSLNNGLFIQYGSQGAKQFIETSIKVATSMVYGLGQGTADTLKQYLKNGKINSASIIASLVVGAFAGFNIGSAIIDEAKLTEFINQQVARFVLQYIKRLY